MTVDHLLILGFGGPTPDEKAHESGKSEAYRFVSGIFGDNPARQARVDEVVGHYEELGGFSKFNEITEAQGDALGKELGSRGIDLKIVCGFDHWHPHIADLVGEIAGAGCREFLTLVMSPHQSAVSWDGYLRRVTEGLESLHEDKRPKWAGVVEPWWNRDGFIDALADRIGAAAKELGTELGSEASGLLLSAHAVPISIVKTSPYVSQVEETATLVAAKLGAKHWRVGYQSNPSDSRIPWTEPFLEQALEQLKGLGAERVVASPIGFLCDNVEVLYDLGVEGTRIAERMKIGFIRAESVNLHPAFIAMLADQVEAKLAEVGAAK